MAAQTLIGCLLAIHKDRAAADALAQDIATLAARYPDDDKLQAFAQAIAQAIAQIMHLLDNQTDLDSLLRLAEQTLAHLAQQAPNLRARAGAAIQLAVVLHEAAKQGALDQAMARLSPPEDVALAAEVLLLSDEDDGDADALVATLARIERERSPALRAHVEAIVAEAKSVMALFG